MGFRNIPYYVTFLSNSLIDIPLFQTTYKYVSEKIHTHIFSLLVISNQFEKHLIIHVAPNILL
jgi:hypothetical protein